MDRSFSGDFTAVAHRADRGAVSTFLSEDTVMNSARIFAALLLPLLGLGGAVPPRATHRADLAFEGRLEPSANVLVGAREEGLLVSLDVELGDVVEAGRKIASLDRATRAAAVELAAARARRTAALERARARLAESDRLVAERDALFAEGLLPASERDELLAARREAEIDLLDAQETLELDRLDHQRALLELDGTLIRAPIRGIVVERLHSPGEHVSRSEPAIVRLIALDPLIVEVALPLEELGRVAIGQLAQVRLEHSPEPSLPATVKMIDPQVDTASSTFLVRLELRNAGERIPAGLRCRVRFDR